MGNYHYFSDEELKGLVPELCAKLDAARHYANTPFVLTSTLRSPDDNSASGGVQDSAHLSGQAIDIRAGDSSTRFKIIRGLIMANFTRIGIYTAHIHADIDETKDKNVAWVGVSH